MEPIFIGRDIGSLAAPHWEAYILEVAKHDDLFNVLDTHPGEVVKLHPKNQQVTQKEMRTLLRYYAPFLSKQVMARWLSGESRLVLYEAVKRIILSLPFGTEAYVNAIFRAASNRLRHHKARQRRRNKKAPERHPVLQELEAIAEKTFPVEILEEQLHFLLKKYGGNR